MRGLLRRMVDGAVWTFVIALVGLVVILLTANSCVSNPPPHYEEKMLRLKSGPTVEQFLMQKGFHPDEVIEYAP